MSELEPLLWKMLDDVATRHGITSWQESDWGCVVKYAKKIALLPEERDEESLCKTCGDEQAEVCLDCARRGMTEGREPVRHPESSRCQCGGVADTVEYRSECRECGAGWNTSVGRA
jgi:hypothetical protein